VKSIFSLRFAHGTSVEILGAKRSCFVRR